MAGNEVDDGAEKASKVETEGIYLKLGLCRMEDGVCVNSVVLRNMSTIL